MAVINILRQYPAERHNTPIRYLARRDGHEIRTHEYDLTSNIGGVFGNIAFIARALFQMENEQIVLAAEPFDPLVLLFHRIAQRNDVVLHTSWPYWESGFVPQPATFNWQRKRWEDFLQDVHAVGVTRTSTESVASAGANEATHIPHSVDTSTYRPNVGSMERNEPVILFVGQLESRKGINEIIDVIKNWDGPETRFWFVGKGPLSDQISALATANDHVEYFGYVSNDEQLAEIYAGADIFTLPSYRVEGWEELFGIVVIEALAAGLPIVTTDCVGPAEIVDEGKTGYIIDQHDVTALRNRLESLVSSPEQRTKMSERARAVAMEHYDNDTVAAQWRRVLEL